MLFSAILSAFVVLHVISSVILKKADLHNNELNNQLIQMRSIDKENGLYADLVNIDSNHKELRDFLKSIDKAEFYSIRIIKIMYRNNQTNIIGETNSIYEMTHFMQLFNVKNYNITVNNGADVMRFNLNIG